MTASAMTTAEKLPVPVLENPHWRVNFRPEAYVPDRLETLADCLDVVRKTRVRLRGWDFPMVPQDSKLVFGDTWIAGSSDFMGHLEYWRFYQSTQFLYLGSIREVTESDWETEIRKAMKWRAHGTVDVDAVPGFLSLTESIYNLTEYFEFAARLAQAQIYMDPVTVTISIKGVAGFMLAAEPGRRWTTEYVTGASELTYTKTFTPTDLIASAADHALTCALWLFERFGWLKPNVDAIRTDQQKLLSRQF
ncbi:MAG TPA: hypothetical protein VF432_12170 [Thermoanaerobaculia bacterium]